MALSIAVTVMNVKPSLVPKTLISSPKSIVPAVVLLVNPATRALDPATLPVIAVYGTRANTINEIGAQVN